LGEEAVDERRGNPVGAADGFLRFSDIDLAAILYKIGVAHADVGVVIVKQDFGLRPLEALAGGRVDLAARHEPGGVAVVIRTAAVLAVRAERADKASAVVVEPVEKLSVGAFPHEVGGARVFDAPAAGRVCLVGGLSPGARVVATVGAGGPAIDGAVDAVKGAVAEADDALLLRDATAPGGRPQANGALRKGFESDF